MNTYLIDPRANGGEQFIVEAADHGEAARLGARKIFPQLAAHIGTQDGAYFAQRETGSPDGSGMFRVWKLRQASAMQSDHGRPFHVMEL